MTYGIAITTEDGRSLFVESQESYPVIRSGAASNPADIYYTVNGVDYVALGCYDLGLANLSGIDRVWQWLPPNIHVSANLMSINGRLYLKFDKNELAAAGNPIIYFAITGTPTPNAGGGYGINIYDASANCIFSSDDSFQHIVITDLVSYLLTPDISANPVTSPISFGDHTDADRLMVCRHKSNGYRVLTAGTLVYKYADAWWKFASDTSLQIQRRTLEQLSYNDRTSCPNIDLCPSSATITIPVGVLK